jgi:hypothetical protein
MRGFADFLGALRVFAVNLSLHTDRVERLRIEPNGGVPPESRVQFVARGFEPGDPLAPRREPLQGGSGTRTAGCGGETHRPTMF